jgi:hypothetical protein
MEEKASLHARVSAIEATLYVLLLRAPLEEREAIIDALRAAEDLSFEEPALPTDYARAMGSLRRMLARTLKRPERAQEQRAAPLEERQGKDGDAGSSG